MAKLYFVTGPIGGGTGELAGNLAQTLRRCEPVSHDVPVLENKVYFGTVTPNNSHPLEEIQHIIDSGDTYTYEIFLETLHTIMRENISCTSLVLGGLGVAMFIEKLIVEFPDAHFYFAKREDPAHWIDAARDQSNPQRDLLTDELISKVEEINQMLTEKIDRVVTNFGRVWTSGNQIVKYVDPALENNGTTPEEKRVHKEVFFLYPTYIVVRELSIQF